MPPRSEIGGHLATFEAGFSLIQNLVPVLLLIPWLEVRNDKSKEVHDKEDSYP